MANNLMNKFYILKYDSQNLGDDIQSIATSDILDDLQIEYEYIYRDLINGYYFNPFVKNNIIFNGWFNNGYGVDDYYSTSLKDSIKITWPPKGNFNPILYSFHISEWGQKNDREINKKFLDDESIEFYKQSEPVACRDENTHQALNSIGIKSYNSKCLTLTLNKNKYNKINRNKDYILFVDVPEQTSQCIIKKYSYTNIGMNMKYLTHTISKNSANLMNRIEIAKAHLTDFCNAKYVFTTRLHVALPCLAFNTPVLFLYNESDNDNNRWKDYLQYLNHLSINDIDSFSLDFENKFDNKISTEIKNDFIDRIKNLL